MEKKLVTGRDGDGCDDQPTPEAEEMERSGEKAIGNLNLDLTTCCAITISFKPIIKAGETEKGYSGNNRAEQNFAPTKRIRFKWSKFYLRNCAFKFAKGKKC